MKTFITGSLAAMMLMVGTPASAQEFDAGNLISDLRAQHAELRAQVESGEITREEANQEWKELVGDARVRKDNHYRKRLANVEEKIVQLAETNPERAEALQDRLDSANERRAEHQAERALIMEQLQNGEITREEARELKSEHTMDRDSRMGHSGDRAEHTGERGPRSN